MARNLLWQQIPRSDAHNNSKLHTKKNRIYPKNNTQPRNMFARKGRMHDVTGNEKEKKNNY